MLYSQFIELKNEYEIDFGIDSSIVITSDNSGRCAANDFVALPIAYTSSRYNRNDVVEIKFHDHPSISGIAFLLTCKDSPYKYSEAAPYHVAAALADADISRVSLVKTGTYSYGSDYLILRSKALSFYEKRYQKGSHIWGGFYHLNPSHFSVISARKSKIFAVPKLKLPTEMHERAVARANSEPIAIGRFLGLYHLIELSFDFDLINDIKALPDNMKKVGKLLATFDEKEFSRLVRLIKKYWPQQDSLLEALKFVFNYSPTYSDQLDEMLFAYGKDGFPWGLKDNEQKLKKFLTIIRGICTLEQLKTNGFDPTVENLQKAVAFVIYRFRCAIAHASIGEYILTLEDEDFVEKLGEPLIRNLVYRMYR